MSLLCLYFKVHQPFGLKLFSAKGISTSAELEDKAVEKEMINNISDECYLPANNVIQALIKKHSHKFKLTYSITGTTLALMLQYRPDVIESFKRLTATGCVEILGETYYNSFSYLHSLKEFVRQVKKHAETVKQLFGVQPAIFRNTELIYDNRLSNVVSSLGFRGVLFEGAARVLAGRSPNKVYAAPGVDHFGLLLRNVRLSDDIAFRFGNKQWDGHPLTAERFARWIAGHIPDTEVINLFMDYETFGIHKKKESGIFDFLQALPDNILCDTHFTFATPSEAVKAYPATDTCNIENAISWEDSSKDDCVWSENVMQNNALKKVYGLENIVLKNNEEHIKDIWGKFQSADYFYYMANGSNRENGFPNFKPFETPNEAFKYYMDVVTNFEICLIDEELKKSRNHLLIPEALLY